MKKDFGRYTIHVNRYYLDNFALGFDYYRLYEFDYNTVDGDTRFQASICQLSFIFFNITLTRWHKWI